MDLNTSIDKCFNIYENISFFQRGNTRGQKSTHPKHQLLKKVPLPKENPVKLYILELTHTNKKSIIYFSFST